MLYYPRLIIIQQTKNNHTFLCYFTKNTTTAVYSVGTNRNANDAKMLVPYFGYKSQKCLPTSKIRRCLACARIFTISLISLLLASAFYAL
jgi:hypothetical protein